MIKVLGIITCFFILSFTLNSNNEYQLKTVRPRSLASAKPPEDSKNKTQKKEKALLTNGLFAKYNFNFENYENNNFYSPDMADSSLKFVAADEIKIALQTSLIISTEYRPLRFKNFYVNNSKNYLIVVDKLFDKNQNKYFELYRLANLSLELLQEEDPKLVEYSKNFRPFIKEIAEENSYHISYENNLFAIATELSSTKQIKIESINLGIPNPHENEPLLIESKGLLKKFYIYNNKVIIIFGVKSEDKDESEDQVWTYDRSRQLLASKEDLFFDDSKNKKIDAASATEFRKFFVINKEIYPDVPVPNEKPFENPYFKCSRVSEIEKIIYKCLSKSLESLQRLNWEKIAKEHGSFINDVFLVDSLENASVGKPGSSTNGRVMINFVDSNQQDALKIGEKLTLMNTDSKNLLNGIFEKNSEKSGKNENTLDSGEGLTGIAQIENYKEYEENRRQLHLAFRNYKAGEFKFCEMKSIEPDGELRKIIKEKTKMYPDKFDLRQGKVQHLTLDGNQYFSYTFFTKEADNATYKTLFYKKEDNKYNLLFSDDHGLNFFLCLKTKESKQWQFLYNIGEKYSGETVWGELIKNKFVNYYMMSAWAD